jgi:peptidoglycan-associated lipoprotein
MLPMFRCRTLLTLTALALLLVIPGCRKSGPVRLPAEEEREPAPTTKVVPPPRDTRPSSEEVDSGGFEGGEDAGGQRFQEQAISVEEMRDRLGTVFFAYDSYDLSPTSLATLRENAEVLKAYPRFRVVVEGHCDERGTIDYNLALGEKRAASVRDYLASLGVERERVRIITYGEERPADPGHSEAAWSKNRRAEFVVER